MKLPIVVQVELMTKKTKEVEEIPLNDFLNHRSTTYAGKSIKPETITQSYNMLRDMIAGQIWQTDDHCVRIKGLPQYAWDWL